VFRGQQTKQMSGFSTKLDCWSKEGTVRCCQSNEAILWSHHEETKELPGERMQGTMPGVRKRGRPRTARIDIELPLTSSFLLEYSSEDRNEYSLIPEVL